MKPSFCLSLPLAFLSTVGALGAGTPETVALAKQPDAPSKQAAIALEFVAITDDPSLPRVLLMGDSVSIAYALEVRRALEGKANVHRVPANCGSTKTALGSYGLVRWIADEHAKWDVIHFNHGLHARHLCYGILNGSGITLVDHKTGVMNLEIRSRRHAYLDRREPLPPELDALLKTKQITVPWTLDHEWHELVLLTESDEMRLSLDGKELARHRSEGFAHPMKRWFSFLANNTVWIDDVKIWKVR